MLLGWLLCGCAAGSPNLTPSEPCVASFNSRFAAAREILQRKALVRSMDNSELRCLFEEARAGPQPDSDFFVPARNRRGRRAQRFFGVNGLRFFREFEKRTLVLNDPDGVARVVGYNVSSIGRLLASPGMFRLEAPEHGPSLLDYRIDFVSWLGSGEGASQLKEWRTDGLMQVKNNEGNPIFTGLTDTLYLVNEDVAVGVAERIEGEKTTIESYFLLLRLP